MFDYVPLGDENVLSELIRNRMSLDASYSAKVYPGGEFSATGGIVFNESIICVYVSLDELIRTAPLSPKQRAVINLMMRGYTIQDIADECGVSRQKVSGLYQRSLDTLVKHHQTRWLGVMTGALREEEC